MENYTPEILGLKLGQTVQYGKSQGKILSWTEKGALFESDRETIEVPLVLLHKSGDV